MANGVDIVLEDPYKYQFSDNYADIVVCSSCFEHAEFFWLSFLEIMRIMKPTGIFYLNVPSNGLFHRTPWDCWRFYPDSGMALTKWARYNKYENAFLLESYISHQYQGILNDFVSIFLKNENHINLYPNRIYKKKR